MNLQDMVDGWSARMQRERADTQMTLGKLIEALEAMPPATAIDNLSEPHSYRGYYSDLAFERYRGKTTAAELLGLCQGAMGKIYHGYKGGDFVMGALTPIWIASYGCCGKKLMQITPDGRLETSAEDD